ncbi:hypothetical protein NA57DRAFT_75692 [Rhizodiscina lignyota]|uniref:Uncharacterized protein n=1 Tax=Rhizodiscina lignyota TaxID=1504668 RepID=A0A9P4IHS4_9PEZI|nr:hypothetical protein NA57DRAFT_75692 [Rhizodiscina lignyota]
MPREDAVRNPLRKVQRHITSHDTTGRAIFSQHLEDSTNSWRGNYDPRLPLGSFLGYAIPAFPVRLINDSDVFEYADHLEQSEDGSQENPSGIRLRFFDLPPGYISSWKRTKSLDFCFVIEGDVECVLDSGASKALKRGDVTVQRGTMHIWRNQSSSKWARMAFVSIDATPVMVNGEWVGDDVWVVEPSPAAGTASASA